jgi:hypothetical protein
MAEETFAYLTTTGWKTGKQHTIEIWYVEHDGCCYLISEMREKAHWVQNILHHANVRYAVGTRTQRDAGTLNWRDGMGGEINPDTEPDLAAQVRALMDAKYKWSEGIMMQLCPKS